MEFEIKSFTESIRQALYENFPYESDDIKTIKHPKRSYHLRDIAFKNNPTAHPMENMTMFEIGGVYAEMAYPYYHILQDAQVIHFPNRGTKKSKGTQAAEKEAYYRDYLRVSWNGKIYTQEYKKNVRGQRSKYGKARRYVSMGNGRYMINKEADTYVNTHYQYIDRILDATLPYIASDYGLRAMRKKDTGLQEEWNAQQQSDIENVLDILDSFTI